MPDTQLYVRTLGKLSRREHKPFSSETQRNDRLVIYASKYQPSSMLFLTLPFRKTLMAIPFLPLAFGVSLAY